MRLSQTSTGVCSITVRTKIVVELLPQVYCNPNAAHFIFEKLCRACKSPEFSKGYNSEWHGAFVDVEHMHGVQYRTSRSCFVRTGRTKEE